MKFLERLNNIKKRHMLLREFKNSKYSFANDEKELGIQINLFGYKNVLQEKTINFKDDMVNMKVGDCELWVPKNSFKPGELSYIYNEIFMSIKENPHSYETEYFRINKGDYVVDAGSCEGFFIKYALQKGAKIVFAFEPLNSLVRGLNRTYVKEIRENNVKIINKGLSEKDELIMFDCGKDYICEAKMNVSGIEKCEVTYLDRMVEGVIIPQIDFIKMDIEGAEILALKGAKNTIKKYKPKLSIASYHEYENAIIIKDLLIKYRPDYKITFGGCYTFEKPFRPFMVYAY